MPFGSYLIRRENGINMQGGGMFFDEMRGQYVNIPIVDLWGIRHFLPMGSSMRWR